MTTVGLSILTTKFDCYNCQRNIGKFDLFPARCRSEPPIYADDCITAFLSHFLKSMQYPHSNAMLVLNEQEC